MNNEPANTNFQKYFWVSGLTALAVLAGIVTLNYLIDPYFIHQWDTALIKRLSPAQQKISPWPKTYAAYRYQPDVVYLGSSRTEIGLPTDSPLLKDQRVLNLALSGASLGDSINMLKHTSYFHRPKMVIWGLDFGWQFRKKTGNTDFNTSLIAQDSWYPLKRTFLNLKRSISMAMSTDTVKMVLGFSEQSCPSLLASYGQKSAQCLELIMQDEGGAAKAFEKIITKGDPQAKPADVSTTMQQLDKVTRDYCQAGTAFRFFFHPVHALAELSYWGNELQALDQWKQQLAQMMDQRKQEGCDIRLMDFSGFNAVTTETIPQQTGKNSMQYYWEHSHYRSEVGQEMLKGLLADSNRKGSSNFGVELTGSTIEQHLANFQNQREQYCRTHIAETRNIIFCNTINRNN
ncbi:MAG: hypothetical protein JZU50_14815 [Desulfobulbaceae bacterium]|jgi:hypothetical protein|nr:hypothetical protein [Desulfobulbaceae bacterium]